MIRLTKKRIYILAASVLLLSSLASVYWAFLKIPTQKEQVITRLNYNIKGEYTHKANGYITTDKLQSNPVYFTKTIKSIEVSYGYRFLAEKLTGVKEEVEIKAVISNPGLWEKEVILFPAAQKNGDFTVSFFLNPGSLLQLAKDISTELGAGAPSPGITLKAVVHTIAQTDKGQIQEQFIQNVTVKLGATTLEFIHPFSQSKRGYFQGISYEQKGDFSHKVEVQSGTLYSNLTMKDVDNRSYIPPSLPPAKPLPNPIYFTRTIDSVDVSYSYRFLAEEPPTKVTSEVEIRALIGSQGLWNKEIILMQPTVKDGDFSITIPLEIKGFLDLAKYVASELGATSPTPDVTLKAIIHTIAQTEKGQVKEEFVHNVKLNVNTGILELVRPFNMQSRGEFQGLKYEQRGSFGYSIHVKPSPLYNTLSIEDIIQRSYLPPEPPIEKPLSNPIYFTKIIESIETIFSYSFLAEKPITNVLEEVELKAIIGTTGLWTKEVTVVPPTLKEGNFTITFPLDVYNLLQLAKNIAIELQQEPPPPEIYLKAIVKTVAQSDTGQIKEEFIQSIRLIVKDTTIEWFRPFNQQDKGEFSGFKYEQRGSFSHIIHLKANKLFDNNIILRPDAETQYRAWWEKEASSIKFPQPEILHPESEPVPAAWWEGTNLPTRALASEPDSELLTIPLEVSKSYAINGLERIDMTFTGEIGGDRPLTNDSHEVSVTAILSKPEKVVESFVLVPKGIQKGKFTISFPLDIGLLYAIIERAEKGSRLPSLPFTYTLLVRAEVKSTAQSAYGTINDSLRHDVYFILDNKSIQIPDLKTATKSGIIRETALAPVKRTEWIRIGSLGLSGLVVTGILYGILSYRQIRKRKVSKIDTEAKQARSKHRDIIVDVENLPPVGDENKVIRLSSLLELVKTADALLKPVLHEVRPEKHTYCVADGDIYYIFISKEEDHT